MTKYITQIADEIWPDVYHQIIEEKLKSLEITSPSARVLRMLIDSALQVIGETGEKK